MQSKLFKKSQFLIFFMNREKLGNIQSPRPTFQNPNVNLWMSWKNLCPNLTFTVENKIGNSYKKDDHISKTYKNGNNGKKLLFKPSQDIYVRKLSFSTSW